MNFEEAWLKTMIWEGGGRVHRVAGDPGGTTKWGISQRAHPNVDVASIIAEEAQQIAHDQYWAPASVGNMPHEIRWDVFDFAFNAGVRTSVKALQRAINLCKTAAGDGPQQYLQEDGVAGIKTLSALNEFPPDRVKRVFRAIRVEHYVSLARTGHAKFVHGWLRRAEGDDNA